MSDQSKRWKEQADFMREVGAVYAEWTPYYDGMGGEMLALTKLTLEPRRAPVAPAGVAPAATHAPPSPAKRLLQMHETQFAASRYRPPFVAPSEITDVPRAVRAKEAARGSKKVPKRGS